MKKALGKILFLTAVFAFLFRTPAPAATSDSIKSVRVEINETKEAPGIVWPAEPDAGSKKYIISEYSWSKAYENWTPGSKISLTVILAPADGYHFDKSIDFNCSGGDIASKTRNSASRITMHINYTPCVILASPTGIYFEDDWTLHWDKVDYAGGYKISLYKNGSSYKTIEVEGRSTTKCDLASYCTDDEATYEVKIKAIAPKGKGNYIKSSDNVNFDENITSGESTVSGELSGSGKDLKFKTTDGGYAQGWQLINGAWYYFDPNNKNKAITNNWLNINNQWYHFDSDGKMQTGWFKDESTGFWYYLFPGSGEMKTGWIATSPNGPYYYLNPGTRSDYPFGAMLSNTVTPDNYYVDSTGKWDGAYRQ